MIKAEAYCQLLTYSEVGARSYLDYVADETRAILREPDGPSLRSPSPYTER